MIKKTMLLFFMPLLIKCLIKIVLKIYMLSGRCSISICCTSLSSSRGKDKRDYWYYGGNERVGSRLWIFGGWCGSNLHSRRYAYVAGVCHLQVPESLAKDKTGLEGREVKEERSFRVEKVDNKVGLNLKYVIASIALRVAGLTGQQCQLNVVRRLFWGYDGNKNGWCSVKIEKGPRKKTGNFH